MLPGLSSLLTKKIGEEIVDSEMEPNSGGRSVPRAATLHGGQRAGGMANASRLFSLVFVKEESS